MDQELKTSLTVWEDEGGLIEELQGEIYLPAPKEEYLEIEEDPQGNVIRVKSANQNPELESMLNSTLKNIRARSPESKSFVAPWIPEA